MLLRFVDDGETNKAEFNIIKSRMMVSKKRAAVCIKKKEEIIYKKYLFLGCTKMFFHFISF